MGGPTPGAQLKGDCPIHTGPTARSKSFCPTHTGRGWLILFFLAAMFQGISAANKDAPACVRSRLNNSDACSTPLDYFINACKELDPVTNSNDGAKLRNLKALGAEHIFQMREHRNNAWIMLPMIATLGLVQFTPFIDVTRNTLRTATFVGWTEKCNPVFKHGVWFLRRYYEVVGVVQKHDIINRRMLTCLECKLVKKISDNRYAEKGCVPSRKRLFHLSHHSRDWLDGEIHRFLSSKCRCLKDSRISLCDGIPQACRPWLRSEASRRYTHEGEYPSLQR